VTRLLLIRHGESFLGAQGRYAGRSDTPLTERGRRQVLDLLPLLRAHPVSRIYSSDLLRCRETARLLARTAYVTPALRELDFGRWEGRSADEIRRREPGLYDAWLADPSAQSPPGGETLGALSRRVRAFAGHLAGHHPDETFVLVTHAGPIRTLVAADPADFWSIDVPPGSLRALDWRPR
jgi:alpha-ribazole phosphatase